MGSIAANIKCSQNTTQCTLDREKETGDFKALRENGIDTTFWKKLSYFYASLARYRKKQPMNKWMSATNYYLKMDRSLGPQFPEDCENGLYGRVAAGKHWYEKQT